MILRNIREDLIFISPFGGQVMIKNELLEELEFGLAMTYAFISNFENGMEEKIIINEIGKRIHTSKKGMEENVKKLLELNYIEKIEDANLEKLAQEEFEMFKASLNL